MLRFQLALLYIFKISNPFEPSWSSKQFSVFPIDHVKIFFSACERAPMRLGLAFILLHRLETRVPFLSTVTVVVPNHSSTSPPDCFAPHAVSRPPLLHHVRLAVPKCTGSSGDRRDIQQRSSFFFLRYIPFGEVFFPVPSNVSILTFFPPRREFDWLPEGPRLRSFSHFASVRVPPPLFLCRMYCFAGQSLPSYKNDARADPGSETTGCYFVLQLASSRPRDFPPICEKPSSFLLGD